MPIYRDRQAKWQGCLHAPKVRVLGSGCWVQLLGARPYCVLRAPRARKAFHDTCCIIALYTSKKDLPVT